MAHDPISLLQKRTYLDSAKFEIPKPEGIIDGTETIYRNTYFKFLKGSNITINGESAIINLAYIDNYNKQKSNLSLNGVYKLKWR